MLLLIQEGILFPVTGRKNEIPRLKQLNLKPPSYVCSQPYQHLELVDFSLQGFVALPWIFSMNSLHSVSIRYMSYTHPVFHIPKSSIHSNPPSIFKNKTEAYLIFNHLRPKCAFCFIFNPLMISVCLTVSESWPLL